MRISKLLLTSLLCLGSLSAFALDKQALADSLTCYANRYARIGKVQVNRVRVKKNIVNIYTNRALSFAPLRKDNVQELRRLCSRMVLGHNNGKVSIFTDKHEVGELIINTSAKNAYRLPEVTPLVHNASRAWEAKQGLDGKHLVVYGSHGLYFQQTRAWWMYQRARLLTTVEDVYTSSYVQPFLVPMLENAGAIVIQPRERDTQTEEIIVDNTDLALAKPWQISADSTGWSQPAGYLHEGDNPFRTGNYAFAQCAKAEKAPTLIYTPAIAKEGEYAVYIAYQTLQNSTETAEYTVVHKGTKTRFNVNQQMGGGTWIYVGTFAFDANDAANNYVTVSGIGKSNQVITSDAVRFGGGMGSVERYPSPTPMENVKSNIAINTDSLTALVAQDPIDWSRASISGFPRFMEGARYWFQYAGIPDSVYNYTNSQNDYTDDYASRGRWVNYLAGGSAAHPDSVGLRIPIHAGLAFHTDAGTTPNDSIVGTLMIYTDFNNDQKHTYPTGVSRMRGRDLGDFMQTQITEDIRALYNPKWQRRRLDNSSYSESRNPEVPMVLLELLSHQNFADMRFGLDPAFRFVVSRAIYKGFLRFIHQQYGTPYIVQPLPVQNFTMKREGSNTLHLAWQERIDSLESTAKPTYYVVYKRINNGDWDNGTRVKTPNYKLQLETGKHYDFRIQAGNAGGVSLYSETLSAGIAANDAKTVLIINHFTSVAAPESFEIDSTTAGFKPGDTGIPYSKTYAYIGEQYEFNRTKPWISDDDAGFGACYMNYGGQIVAGNTFDYPSLHGKALMQAGYSYISSSVGAVQAIDSTFAAVDLICGKERNLFPAHLQKALTDYTNAGGKVLASGAFMAAENTKQFTRDVLHYEYRTTNATRTGQILMANGSRLKAQLHTEPNAEVFQAENVQGLTPVGKTAETAARYVDSGVCAAVKDANLLIFGFPLESTQDFKALYLHAIKTLLD